jgi:hypothetical protein
MLLLSIHVNAPWWVYATLGAGALIDVVVGAANKLKEQK